MSRQVHSVEWHVVRITLADTWMPFDVALCPIQPDRPGVWDQQQWVYHSVTAPSCTLTPDDCTATGTTVSLTTKRRGGGGGGHVRLKIIQRLEWRLLSARKLATWFKPRRLWNRSFLWWSRPSLEQRCQNRGSTCHRKHISQETTNSQIRFCCSEAQGREKSITVKDLYFLRHSQRHTFVPSVCTRPHSSPVSSETLCKLRHYVTASS